MTDVIASGDITILHSPWLGMQHHANLNTLVLVDAVLGSHSAVPVVALAVALLAVFTAGACAHDANSEFT